jgi:hypothetical protein
MRTNTSKYPMHVAHVTKIAPPAILFDWMSLSAFPSFWVGKLSLSLYEEPVGVARAITQASGVSVRVLLSRAACRHMHLNNELGSIPVSVLVPR